MEGEFIISKTNSKKITRGYCDNGELWYEEIIFYNEYDQPYLIKETIHNADGTILKQEQKIPVISLFGKLEITNF